MICGELRNYFETARYSGRFTIVNGMISPADFLAVGQYYRIVGSVFNDGVHRYMEGAMTDEEFEGEVWAMTVPPALMSLAEEIEAYAASDAARASPYVSESFGGYSYSRGGSKGTSGMNDNAWQKIFASRLNRWRKI